MYFVGNALAVLAVLPSGSAEHGPEDCSTAGCAGRSSRLKMRQIKDTLLPAQHKELFLLIH